ncbi:MAG: M10 family metallopeptidase C-terminal domain-containing protein [Gemmataceae bacterium]
MSRNHLNSRKPARIICLALAMLAVPVTVEAKDHPQPAGWLRDIAGNFYGVVQTDAAQSGDWHGPLTSVIRFANATLGASAPHRGKAIRLKPHSRKHSCSQMLRGNDRNNLLDGSMSACDETILGYGGDDVLIGGPGNNTLNGGAGADVIKGGGGMDTFVYERAGDSPVDAPDIITDFTTRDDVIDLGGVARTSGVPLSFIGWNPFTGVAGQVNYELMEYWKCNRQWKCNDEFVTVVQVDLDGDGIADFAINLYGTHFLEQNNFVLGPEGQQSERN